MDALKERVQKFVECFGRWCSNRRVFRSKKGRFGWDPNQVRVGDVVGVLNGGAVPFVLRPVVKGWEFGPGEMEKRVVLVVDGMGEERMVLRPEVEKGSFEVVGICYLHGVMEGEAMEIGFAKVEICLV